MYVLCCLDETDALPVGCELHQPCAVVSEVDGCWHRGQLVSIDEEQDVFQVHLVDVGRTEQTSRQCLRLMQLTAMTTPVSLLRLHTQFINQQGQLHYSLIDEWMDGWMDGWMDWSID